jgi:hypothetical protein
MPRPNRPDEFKQINFLVNYFIQGCSPPAQLFLEFAKEPAADLALLILGLDAGEVGESMLDSKKGRTRKPGRHGRKRGLYVGLPDPNDMVAQRLDRAGVITDIVRITPLKYVIPLWNVWEGITFTAAVVEGFTGTFYEAILGVVTVSEDQCTNLDFIRRRSDFLGVIGGPSPSFEPINCNVLERSFGFVGSRFGCRNVDKPFRVNFSIRIRLSQPDPSWFFKIALYNATKDIVEEASIVPGGSTAWKNRSVSMAADPGDEIQWGWSENVGFAEYLDAEAVGYSIFNYPWDT